MGLFLLLVATPATVIVILTTAADWAFVAAILTFAAGLVVLGTVVAPDRTSFRGGTKVWQNDGLPGGGGTG
ncbi:MAG: hypothetical protein M3211_00435 [Actinomycetota bacterium]|nr:hypothetical protein [Actinomycetota bacterium]